MQDGTTPLILACKACNKDIVQYLCEIGGEELMMLTDEVSLSVLL